MAARPLLAMIRKDLQLFFSDPRAMLFAFAMPIAIASFFGAVFSGPRRGGEAAKIPIAIVDEDGSAISKGIVADAQSDMALTVSLEDADRARDEVRRGKTTIGVVIPKGFGDASGRAFFRGTTRPELQLLYDPSHSTELAMVRGILTEHVMKVVSREMFTGADGRRMVEESLANLDKTGLSPERQRLLRELLTSVQSLYNAQDQSSKDTVSAPGLSMPYTVHEEAVTARADVAYNAYAHAFAGMGVQFLLFAAANLGVDVLLERQRGVWKRLRSAPVSKTALLTGKTLSMTIISLLTLVVSFAFAIVVLGVRIQGSLLGFAAVSIACSLMAAAFGMLIAALGRTPAATRGVTTLAVLLMVMLGGAWVPTFIFPAWLQQITVVVPVRWAVDGLDAMTWRGLGLASAAAPTLVLVSFAIVFWAVAANRFRWEEA